MSPLAGQRVYTGVYLTALAGYAAWRGPLDWIALLILAATSFGMAGLAAWRGRP